MEQKPEVQTKESYQKPEFIKHETLRDMTGIERSGFCGYTRCDPQ